MNTQTKPAKAITRRTPTPRPAKKQPRISARNRALLRLLDTWENATPEEIEEQRETHEVLQRALVENHLSLRIPLVEHLEEEPDKDAR